MDKDNGGGRMFGESPRKYYIFYYNKIYANLHSKKELTLKTTFSLISSFVVFIIQRYLRLLTRFFYRISHGDSYDKSYRLENRIFGHGVSTVLYGSDDDAEINNV